MRFDGVPVNHTASQASRWFTHYVIKTRLTNVKLFLPVNWFTGKLGEALIDHCQIPGVIKQTILG